MKNKARSGSVTVLASVSLMLVAGLIFTLLEGARFREVQRVAGVMTQTAAESLFSHYEPTLWDAYHFLALEAGAGNDHSVRSREAWLKDTMDTELGTGNQGSLLQMSVKNVSLEHCLYVSDQEGAVFESAVSAYMQNNIAYELYHGIAGLSEEIANLKDENLDEKMQDARDELASLEEQKARPSMIKQSFQSKKKKHSEEESALDVAKEIDATGISALVLPSHSKISNRMMDEDHLSARDLQEGDGETVSTNVYQTMLTILYLGTYFSSYTDVKENHGLQYELEYILGGKTGDSKNLNAAITKLFAVRELANFAYIITDSAKVSEAETMATVISVVTLMPAAMEAIKYGILAAWSCAESVLDLRALLAGKKVALIKNSAQWSTDLWDLLSVWDHEKMSEECENGFDYNSYLLAMILLQSQKTRSSRALDVMELTVREAEKRPDFCINDCIVESGLSASFQYHTAFAGMDLLTEKREGTLFTEAVTTYSYRKAGV